ncbi:MAG: aminotransferase class V-fold PLP-dependent enzyme [Acidimicrobiales bacterium]|jgi:alanine-glyoxylate transaminase/serine-glyoxylate transaminase/serine-pyruvate transaminase|nr:aminotransferase class V-fold PLP-dependent enzyme [Acidimicrobiales bacterium]
MSLSYGRPMVSIPGPSVIPDRVLAAMHRPMPNIYEGDLIEVSFSVQDDLRKIARTEQPVFISVSNGHGAWEMAISNTLSRGDKVLVLESGTFAVGWGEMAEVSGVKVEILSGSHPDPVNPEALEERLKADISKEIAAVMVVQVDTATSVRNDIQAIREAMDAADHPALLMVDCIASLGCESYEHDEWGADITVAATQKGLMVPPGLGFVFASEKALAAHEKANLRSGYFDWEPRSNPDQHYKIYCGTPPIQHLWAMREALDMLFEEGLENVWERHRILADAVRAAVDAWHAPNGFSFNVAEPQSRSNSVTTILTGDIDAAELRRIAEADAGLTLGIGLDEFANRAFRIGHMGHLNPPMILGTLGTIEATLARMGAPMSSSGSAAAAAVIGAAL